MQIRIRKTSVALIRTVYDPTIKRGRSLQLGALPLDATTAPDELLSKLTTTEQYKLDSWLSENARRLQRTRRQHHARELPEILSDVASWYRMQRKAHELSAVAKASRDAWTEVLAAMVSAGVGRRRKRSTKKKPA